MKYECIIAILPRGEADRVMEDAKKAGAQGGTIFLARGTGAHEAKTFFGLTLESSREILMILTKDDQTDTILDTIVNSAHLDRPGAGIAFVLDVNRLIGLQHRKFIERSDKD
ncbi:MAG: P-II family nitrogen regulator [Limnochordia bacterium]